MSPDLGAWPAGSPRVLVTDCWLQNAGDAAIAVATQRLILDIAPGASVLHAAYGVEHVADRYPELAFCAPLDRLTGTEWAPALPGGPDLVREADVLISQGGGFMREGYRPWARVDALERASQVVPVTGFIGQTIGRFDVAFGRAALGRTLRRASAVVVRDRTSGFNAIDLGADPAHVALGTDVSLALLDPDRPAVLPASPHRGGSTVSAEPPARGIAMTLSDHVVPGESLERSHVAGRYLAAALRRWPDEPITVWSSSQGIREDSEDDVVAEGALRHVRKADRDRVHLVPGHLDAYDLFGLATSRTALLSMRFHPALIAAAAGIPSVLAMSDPKVEFFVGSAMADRVVTGHDDESAERAATLADPDSPRRHGRDLLGPAFDRLQVVRDALAALIVRG